MRRSPAGGLGLAVGLAVGVARAFALAAPASAQAATEGPIDLARRVLSTTPLIDGHNDLPWEIRESTEAPFDVDAPANDLRSARIGQTDIERLRRGQVGAQFWSVYVPFESVEDGAAKTQLEQIDIALRLIDRYPDVFELALSPSDVERIFGSGRIASTLGMEGGHAIENSLGALRAYYAMGVRYMTLTHDGTLDWADSRDDPRRGGLTAFGMEVVREMNRLGMLVDLSHTSVETMNDALDVAEAPVIWSHAGARAIRDHTRNVPDQVLRRLPQNGGVVMVVFYPPHLTANEEATLSDVANHVEHIASVAGVDHVGIGSDFDGMGGRAPRGLEDVSKFPALFVELARRGWSEEDLRKLAGENVLRAWREAEVVSRRLRRERSPSTATIEDLDGVPASSR